MEQQPLVVAVSCLAAGVIVLAVLLARQWYVTIHLRGRNTMLADGLRLRDEELRHLATTRLPELVESLHDRPVTVSGPLDERRLEGTDYGKWLQVVLELCADSVRQAKDRADQSAKAALKAMMRAVQSLANEQQVAISNMQDRHDNPNVLEDLLRIDHMNAQLGRRAQATAVLCGSWPGQQRAASSLSDVVRGATSRIRDYLRVRIHSPLSVALVSRAVEPVVLAIAELLDNAARHSHPSTTVEVNFQQTHNGVAIMIDDAGVAMHAEELSRASVLLSGSGSMDIYSLGDPPQVGFAVTGVLAARYGFTVSVDTRSPYGGARAVVFLPAELLTAIPEEPETADRAPEAVEPHIEAPPETPSEAPPVTTGGLPKRRRVEPAGEQGAPHTQSAGKPARPARETAAGMGAWQRGTRSGRAGARPESEGEGKDLQP